MYAAFQVSLPAALKRRSGEVALRDVQYTLQVEDVDLESDAVPPATGAQPAGCAGGLALAAGSTARMSSSPPTACILEMGAVYQVARYLDIPVVTYEFGEQRGRIWLAQNGEVMRQETDMPVAAVARTCRLTQAQWEQVRSPVCLSPARQPVGELLPPLAGHAQPGRRAGAPGPGAG